MQEFNVKGGNADELLGYDPEEDESSDEDRDENESDDEEGGPSQGQSHTSFQRQVRVDATQRAERNRRIGGLKTQRAMQKGWNVSPTTTAVIVIH